MPASDHYWRPLGTMHTVFAGSAIVLFGATIIMMAADEDREWRHYQTVANDLLYQKLQEESSQYTRGAYQQQIAELEAKINAAEDALSGDQTRIDQLKARLEEAAGEVQLLQRESKDKNANRDVARANYDLGVRDGVQEEDLKVLRDTYEDAQKVANDFARQLETALTRRGEIQAELDALNESVADAKKELQDFKSQQEQLHEQMDLLVPENWFSRWKREIKTWPIINGFNPELTLQDKQDWLPDLKQQLGMARVARFDRCRACHVYIDRFASGGVPAFPAGELGEGGYPQPFSSHPQSELYVADASPHPKAKFGCTICHDGDGSGTSFQTAEHTPDDPIQARKWEDEHDWHANHFWEYPMLPSQFIESTCIKCHHNVVELGLNSQYGATAPHVYEGYNLISRYGCFGCHEINGYDGGRSIGPDLRLEPNTPEELARIESDPNQVPGRMRKVGPSLRHVADKTTREFIAYWVEIPKRFRPNTRMPQFFDLTNQRDALAAQFQPVELAGIAAYLTEKSEPLELEHPMAGYTPDPQRGKHLFSRRGCLACHTHDDPDFAGIAADFGPNLTRVHEKIRPGQEGFNWLYTWLRDPTRHSPRTRMPNLFLTPEGEGDNYVDPAADIAAFLLQGGPTQFPEAKLPAPYPGVVVGDPITPEEAAQIGLKSPHGVRILTVLRGSAAERTTMVPEEGVEPAVPQLDPLKEDDILLMVGDTPIESGDQLNELIAGQPLGNELVLTIWRDGREQRRFYVVSDGLTDLTRLYLEKSISSQEMAETLESGIFKRRERVASGDWEFVAVAPDTIKGDDVELARRPGDGDSLDDQTKLHRELVYVGRRTISRYGCYGCHDIPGFEDARPIGTTLQDWGRKDTSKLAPEHIEEWLQHHGEPDDSSTHERIEEIINPAHASTATHQQRMAAFFYESLMHHGRAGFLWQKLRQPRSYDYRKVETKGWDERLRMPKFPFSEDQIEEIATFVLGLVADPPPSQYLYQPTGAAYARVEGERLLWQYNCTGCHMLKTPGFRYEADLRELVGMTRQELEDWFTDRAGALQEGIIPQTALSGESLPDGFTPPEGISAEFARRLQEQAALTSPSLDKFLQKLNKEITDEAERAKPQSFVIADTDTYYRDLFGAIGNPEDRAAAIARERTYVAHMGDFLPNAEQFLKGRLLDVSDIQVQITPLIGRLAGVEVKKGETTPLQKWLDEHHELLLVDSLPAADEPRSIGLALSLKPPVSHGPTIESADGTGMVEAHGLIVARPDPEETDPEFRQYVFDLWENLNVGGRYKLMGVNSRFLVQENHVEEILPARGGDFAQWLVPQLVENEMAGDFNKSWQASPPPLYKEGVKVQTPWLFRFLQNPEQLRYTTVLRMPRFNMSESEARSLANYFAAVDDQPFPYQENYRHQPGYLAERSAEFQATFPGEGDDYLFTSWKVLNAPLCIKCHAVGGRPYQGSDPTKDIQGPHLQRVQERLRPEWVNVWLYKPASITSYTSMPSNYPANQRQFPELFGGDPHWQVEALVDALMNYSSLMEHHGLTIYEPPMTEENAAGATETGNQ